MIPSTSQRVPFHTAPHVNQRIKQETKCRVQTVAAQGAEAIDKRLRELDREWDIERMLEANAASVALFGVALGTTVNRKFFIIPAVVGAFLLQHAVQGWCPPVPILRRLGFRTQNEIEEERYALKALRGDFRDVQSFETALNAAQI